MKAQKFQIVAVNTVREAGRIIMSYYGKTLEQIDKPGIGNEFLTEADKESHEYLKEAFSKAFPDLPILSEEDDPEEMLQEPYPDGFISIDPLDGTGHFLMKSGLFAVQAALISKGQPIAGVIYQPARDLLFVGNGKKTYLNGWPLVLPTQGWSLRQSWITHDFAYEERAQKTHRTLEKLADICGYPILPGCVSFGMTTMLLGGVLRGAVYPGMSHWDLAAPVVIVKGAKGKVTDFNGNENLNWHKRKLDVVASVGSIHKELLEALK